MRSCQSRARATRAPVSAVTKPSVGDDPAAAHPDVGDRIAPDGVDEMRNRIVAGDGIDRREVRPRSCRPPCPATSDPIAASWPSARAPPSVAASSACDAGNDDASLVVTLASSDARRISAKRSSRLFDAAPSVPSATLIPRAANAVIPAPRRSRASCSMPGSARRARRAPRAGRRRPARGAPRESR